MKLLYITGNLPIGNGEAFLIPEIDELLRRGHDVRIVPRSPLGTFVHNDARHLQERSCVLPLFCGKILAAALVEALLHPLAAMRGLATLLSCRKARTIMKNLAVYPKGLWLAGVARKWRADHIHAHWISTPATMAMIAGAVAGIPWSCTAHRVDISHDNLLRQKIARATFARFISRSGVAMAASLGATPPSDKTAVIHVGVAIPDQAPCPAAAEDPRTLLCPANLYPVKGHAHLIRAMAILRDRSVDCVLQIAGEGVLRSELEQLAGDLRLGGVVQFLGQVSHDAILSSYGRREIGMVVLPSVDLGNNLHEGIPVSLMEAMAYGIPVVSTTTGGISELLCEGAGMLVPPQDPTALADAIERVLGDPALRRGLVEKGRIRVQESFSVQSVVPALLARIGGADRAVTG
jgi:glycosyltransferase involved in cell wall biosynthesis